MLSAKICVRSTNNQTDRPPCPDEPPMSSDPHRPPPDENPPERDFAGYASESTGPDVWSPDRSEVASKKLAAGLCGILLGGFGVHKFILGYNNAGIIMLVVTVASLLGGIPTCGLTWPVTGVMSVIGLVEGIIYLTQSDDQFYETYMVGTKEWF